MIVESKVQRWAEREINQYLDQIIVPGAGHDLVVFGRFVLRPAHSGCEVLEMSNHRGTFSDRRVALSWCVAANIKRYDLAKTIAALDQQLSSISQDYETRKRLALRSRCPAFRDRVLTKIQTKQSQRMQAREQLEKYISLTKYLQLKGFTK